MVIIEMFSWWYTEGWHVFMDKIHSAFKGIINFFSMGSLIRTLFKPFRQISANNSSEHASLDLKFHMFIDRLISRVVGFFARLLLLIVGTILIIIGGGASLILILIWPIIPLIPIATLILSLSGVLI